MMGHKEKLKSGGEYDATASCRHWYNWKPGVLHKIKKALSKRARKNAKKECQ